MHRLRWTAPLLVVAMVLSLVGVSYGAGPDTQDAQIERMAGGPRAIVWADPAFHPLRVSAPEPAAGLAAASVSFTVNYGGSWTAEAKVAFQYAVSIWAAQVSSSQAIQVEAYWADMGAWSLGAAGPVALYRGFAHAPDAGTWYSVALANAIANTDLNGSGAEIVAYFNSARSDWYYGIDGNPGFGQYDFASVVMHELAHGLGFIGSMDVDTGGSGSWGYGTAYPDVFDRFLQNGAGQSLLSAFPNPSTLLGGELTGSSGGVVFGGVNAVAANGGSPVALYTPATWNAGSSVYHLDEAFNGTDDALMTYSLYNGESVHDPGDVTRGILRDIGWDVVVQPDLYIGNRVAGATELAPGAPITFTLSIHNNGATVASGVVVVDALPSIVVSPSYDSSPSLAGLTAVGSTPFTWELPDLQPGATGVITIYGTIDSGLPDDYATWNTAAIESELGDMNASDNQSTVLVGGYRTYLSAVLKSN